MSNTPSLINNASDDTFYLHYRDSMGKRILYETQLHDPITVEYMCSDAELNVILDHINSVWTRLGKEDPHWSVVSTPIYRSMKMGESLGQFRNSGRVEVENLKRLLTRINMPSPSGTVLEYGCGVGRVTRWLAELFSTVIGVDISSNHLALANEYFTECGLVNTRTIRISDVQNIKSLPHFDFLYSKIVFQHNPPPVMHYILDALCEKLNSGGIGVIQIPTYCKGYEFRLSKYIETMVKVKDMEMHVLPQYAVFDILDSHNCLVREVFRDHMITRMDFVSSTIVFCKR